MMKWLKVPIKEIADVMSGFGFPREQQGSVGEKYPFFKVGDMNLPGNEKEMTVKVNTISEEVLKKLRAKVFPAGTIIFPKIGAAIATNKKRMLVMPSLVDNNVMGLIPKPMIDKWYLFYWMQQFDLRKVTNIGPVPSMRKTEVEEVTIPLPTPSEQQRIVELLDKADALRLKRNASDAIIERLLLSQFFGIFGDPVTNEKRWPTHSLGELLLSIDGGWSPRCLDRSVENHEWGVLKLGAVTWCRYYDSENKALSPEMAPIQEIEVKEGDVLFTRKNTRELVAACALVTKTRPKLMIPDLIFRLNIKDKSILLPEYLAFLLGHTSMRTSIQQLASGSAGSMPNISKERLRSAEIPVPPIQLQEKFASHFGLLEKIHESKTLSHDKLQKLFQTLLQRAFSGNLTAKWREVHMRELLAEMEEQVKYLEAARMEGE